jgi:hypothetical protein
MKALVEDHDQRSSAFEPEMTVVADLLNRRFGRCDELWI